MKTTVPYWSFLGQAHQMVRSQLWLWETYLDIRPCWRCREVQTMASKSLHVRSFLPYKHHLCQVFDVSFSSFSFIAFPLTNLRSRLTFYYRIFAIPQFRRLLFLVGALVTCYVVSVDLVCLFQWSVGASPFCRARADFLARPSILFGTRTSPVIASI